MSTPEKLNSDTTELSLITSFKNLMATAKKSKSSGSNSSSSSKKMKRSPNDPNFQNDYTVYIDTEGDEPEIFSCMLNQTDIGDNKNKFYVIELLKKKNKKLYTVYTRYGRIGEFGKVLIKDSDIELGHAIKEFTSIFRSKTGNAWKDRENFVLKPKKYFMTQLEDDSPEEETDEEEEKEEKDKKDVKKTKKSIVKKSGKNTGKKSNETDDDDDDDVSDTKSTKSDEMTTVINIKTNTNAALLKDHPQLNDSGKETAKKLEVASAECMLDKRIQTFIALISNIEMMTETMKDFNIDLKRMPLGKISKKQIKEGFETLKKIAKKISDNSVKENFTQLSSIFYTYVPVSVGRTSTPPIINNEKTVEKYVDMLQVLSDLEIAGSILDKKNLSEFGKMHRYDRIYKQLKIDLTPIMVDSKSKEYKMITTYVNNTVAPTHNYYTLEVLDAIKVNREEENARFNDYGNNVLLFHGSRVANYMGILSQGLRINNNAPKTGSMFGPGSYFSNCATKSANYCYASPSNNEAIMLLCMVSLGKTYNKLGSEYITYLPNEKNHSTWGQGKSTTNPKEAIKIKEDGTKRVILVPYGKLIDSDVKGSLLYDEFIVYKENQVKIKYAIRLKFNYKSNNW